MNLGLPESYLSPIELPFNHASLNGRFQLASPNDEPATCGVWLVLQGNTVLAVDGEHGPDLPEGDSALLTNSSPPVYIGNWDGRPCRLLSLPFPRLPLPLRCPCPRRRRLQPHPEQEGEGLEAAERREHRSTGGRVEFVFPAIPAWTASLPRNPQNTVSLALAGRLRII